MMQMAILHNNKEVPGNQTEGKPKDMEKKTEGNPRYERKTEENNRKERT
jgi:hypothetical protein